MTSKIKKKKSCQEIMKILDIFGTTVDFSFRNSHRFGTRGGLIISIIIVVFMLFYSILIILDSVNFSKPFILTSYISLSLNDILNIETNFPNDLIQANKSDANKDDLAFEDLRRTKKQFSFALVNIETNKLIPYDPTYFIINGFVVDEAVGSNLLAHAELCKDEFAYASNETFAALQLGKSYCFHSDFVYRDTYPAISSGYAGFRIKVKRCVNNTYSYVAKEKMPAYKRIKTKYNEILNSMHDSDIDSIPLDNKNNSITVAVNVRKNSSYKKRSELIDNKGDLEENSYIYNKNKNGNDMNNNTNNSTIDYNNKNIRQTYDTTTKSYTDSSFKNININILHKTIADNLTVDQIPLVCQTKEIIEAQIPNLKLIIYHNNFLLNSTKDVQPIIPKVDSKECYLSRTLSKEKLFYFTQIKLETQNSLIPQSLSNRPSVNYYMSLESENVVYGDANLVPLNLTKNNYVPNSMEDLDNLNENLINVVFALYNYKREIVRRYRDIFEIMGNIGGLSKIFMLLGFCLISYYAGFRKKEALMNELYTNKASLSLQGFKNKLKTKLTYVSQEVIKRVFAYCDKEFKENGGDEMQNRYSPESRNMMQMQVDIDDENKNNEENNDFVLDAKDVITRDMIEEDARKINSLCKRIYLEFCDEQNSEVRSIWALAKCNRKWEFYNRIFCRAFVKFYFLLLAQQFGLVDVNLTSENKQLHNKNDSNNVDSAPVPMPKREMIAEVREHVQKNFEDNAERKESFCASMVFYINDLEASNYKSLAENIDTENAANFRFEFYEIFCFVCCRSCATSNFRRRCKEFDSKYEEFLEQTDFNEIINSLQEFKTFKKTFFEKGQLWLFDSCPIKAITYEDGDELDSKETNHEKDLAKETETANKDLNLEKIFQKYFAKEDFKKLYGIKSNVNNKNLSPLNLINDNNNKNKAAETEDDEDVRFYDNLFSQLVEKPAEDQSKENNLIISENKILIQNKELIGDICQITENEAGSAHPEPMVKSANNADKAKPTSDKIVQNFVTSRHGNSPNNPANPNTASDNYNNNNNNNNTPNIGNNARKYDLKKLNDQIIQKFGK